MGWVGFTVPEALLEYKNKVNSLKGAICIKKKQREADLLIDLLTINYYKKTRIQAQTLYWIKSYLHNGHCKDVLRHCLRQSG